MNAMTTSNTATRIVTIRDLARTPSNDVAPEAPVVDELIIQLRARSRRAATEMYKRFAPAMLRVARSRAGAADADDIVHEAMLAALTAATIPDTSEALGRWLNAIVYNAARGRKAKHAATELRDAVAFLEDPSYDFDPPNAARDEEP